MRTLLLLLCLTLPLQARLGETLEECIKRYGEPIEKAESDTVVAFRKGDFALTVFFVAGKAEWITFTKPGAVFAEEMSDTEIKTLLEANSGALKWAETKARPAAFARGWVTPKRERASYYETLEHKLHIMTRLGKIKLDERNKKKEQDALKDF